MSLLLRSLVQADQSYVALPSLVVQVGRKRYRPIWCPLRRPAATTSASPMPWRAIVLGSGTIAMLTVNESDCHVSRLVAALMNKYSPLR